MRTHSFLPLVFIAANLGCVDKGPDDSGTAADCGATPVAGCALVLDLPSGDYPYADYVSRNAGSFASCSALSNALLSVTFDASTGLDPFRDRDALVIIEQIKNLAAKAVMEDDAGTATWSSTEDLPYLNDTICEVMATWVADYPVFLSTFPAEQIIHDSERGTTTSTTATATTGAPPRPLPSFVRFPKFLHLLIETPTDFN